MKVARQMALALAAAGGFGLAGTALAAPTQILDEGGYAAFADGEFRQVALDQNGVLRPAPVLGEPADLGATLAWAAVADGQGGHYLALGPEARVVRRTAAGELVEVHRFSEGLVRALTVAPDGTLYVGTSAPGRIYRINAEGRAEIWHAAEETYLWDLLADAEGGLLVATGGPGKVYRLGPGHKAGQAPEAWWTPPGGQVTSLVRTPSGTVLAGTSGDGLLVRLEGPGKAEVLWATEGAEVRAILPEADGGVVFATFSGASAESGSSGSGSGSSNSGSSGNSSSSSRSGSAGSAAGSDAPQGGGALLRWAPDGFVRALWSPPRGGIFSVAAAPDGGYLAGTNDAGRLYRVAADGTWSLLQQTPQGTELSRLPAVEGGVALLTSHPARWYTLGSAAAESARYGSSTLDARQPARWASLWVEGVDGGATPVQVQVRTGHTAKPGPTWSEWRDATEEEPGRWVVGGSPARYLQYALTFRDTSAAVRRVRAFSRSANQAPQVTAVRGLPMAFGVNQQAAQPPNIDLRRLVEDANVEGLQRDPSTARLQFRHTPVPGTLTLAWRAADPDGDDLRFRVSLRREPDGAWLVVGDDLEDSWLMLPVTGLEEGLYRARVEASDAIDNQLGEALVGVRESDPFMLDLTAPTVTVAQEGARRWRITAEDQLSLIRKAWYQVDAGDEVRLRPEDGVFDQRRESFVIDGTAWPEGARSVRVFVADEAGQVGSAAW